MAIDAFRGWRKKEASGLWPSGYQGRRLNSPNDLVFKSNGDLYFTDPPYGLPKQLDDPRCELDFCGVYRLSADGQLTLLTKDMTRPNGIAFSPDEKTLYVAESDPQQAVWMAFDVKDDGTLGKGRVFFDATGWAKEASRSARRPGHRPRWQFICDRARRRSRVFARRHAPGHAQHRWTNVELYLGRRWFDALHHRPTCIWCACKPARRERDFDRPPSGPWAALDTFASTRPQGLETRSRQRWALRRTAVLRQAAECIKFEGYVRRDSLWPLRLVNFRRGG